MKSAMRPGSNERIGIARALAVVTQIGVIMVVCVFAGVWIGNWIDSKLGTTGIFLIVCILLGVAAGFMNVYRVLTKGLRKRK